MSVEEAKQAIAKLHESEVALSWRLLDARDRLDVVKQISGTALLDEMLVDDAKPAPISTAQYGAAAAEVARHEGAIGEARTRRRNAILAMWQEHAAELVARAEAIETRIRDREERVAPILAELQEISGAMWKPAGTTLSGFDGSEAEGLRMSAAQQKNNRVSDRGELTVRGVGTNTEHVLQRLAQLDPMTIGPTIVSVADWLTTLRPALDRFQPVHWSERGEPHTKELDGWIDEHGKRATRTERPDIPRSALVVEYTIAWHAGELQPERCNVRQLQAEHLDVDDRGHRVVPDGELERV